MILALQAIILGIVEGITEFIPVSSTGHLIIASEFLAFDESLKSTFSVAIQLGAILAVTFTYPEVFKPFLNPKNWFSEMGKKIMVAILPFLIFGFIFYSAIKTHLFGSHTVAIGLIVGGLIMIAVDGRCKKQAPKTKDLDKITLKQAAIVGLCQCASLWPGTSRSGASIVGGLLAGLDYKIAASFSFIIAVPVMLAAVSYDLLKSAGDLSVSDLQLIVLGLVVSFIVGIFAIKFFLRILSSVKLSPFGFYRIAVGIWILI